LGNLVISSGSLIASYLQEDTWPSQERCKIFAYAN
jgi:hypothetical protein